MAKDKLESPLFQARCNALKTWLPLRLEDRTYGDLRRAGFSRSGVDAIVDHLVETGEVTIDATRSYLIVYAVRHTASVA